jgi:uncharacterized protein (TIGR00255 family)
VNSMTGYGEAGADNGRYRIDVRIRTVNHRALDLALRLPESCRQEEETLRRCLSESLQRGRVDLWVDVRSLSEPAVHVEVRDAAILALAEAAAQWRERGWIQAGLAPADLLRLPGVVELRTEEGAWEDADHELLHSLVDEALAQLVAAREQEGAALATNLDERLATLRRVHEDLEGRRGQVVAGMQSELRARLDRLLSGVDIDPQRLAQEAAILVDRADIQEELDRLDAHLTHFAATMAEDGALGKRLDFIAQEISRELNTIGSKARDAELTRVVVEGKTACEQVREQLQNVE